jgi:hypothetical protein
MAGLVTTRLCSLWALDFIAFIFVLESVAPLCSRVEGDGGPFVSAVTSVSPEEAFGLSSASSPFSGFAAALLTDGPAPFAVAGMSFLSSPAKSFWTIACPIFSFSLPRKDASSCEAFTCPDCILSSDLGWIELFERNLTFSSHGFHRLPDKAASKLDTKESGY